MIRPALYQPMIEQIEREKAATAMGASRRTDLFGNPSPRGSGRSNLVDVEADLRHETPGDNGAFLLFDGTKEVWVPKSLVEHNPHDGTFAMPEGLAKDKGLI